MPAATYDAISTTVLANSGTTTVLLNNITGSYTHLRIVCKVRMALSSTDSLYMRINGDSGSNYAYTQLATLNGNPMSTGDGYTTSIYCGEIPGSSGDGISNMMIDFFDYSNASYRKGGLWRLADFQRFNSSQYARAATWNWFQSPTITSVTFFSGGGGAFLQDSSFALYGIARE